MSRTIRTLLAVVALAGSTPALAQDLVDTTTPHTETSVKVMIQGAKDALSEMTGADQAVGKNLDSAERAGDASGAECIRDRYSKISALIAVSSRAQTDMNTALASKQDARADHEYRKIQVALTKARQFRAEALACQGEGAVADGQTQVTVSANLGTTDDTQGLGVSDGVVGIDPPRTTPFN
ncbi:MAG: hypothetical protein GXP62_12205 [Oligoflexia bacterium]|nr:hypothetical protein [Oligoflexia bacterium]